MGIWDGAHHWMDSCLPPPCDFSVLEFIIFKLTLSFWLAAPLVQVSKHPHRKAGNSLNILKSSFWELLFKSKANCILRDWMGNLPFLPMLEIPG